VTHELPPRLVQLPASVTVTVTREEDHQDVLSGYRSPDVVAELAWGTARAGKYRGQRVIEVQLDGRRVGELTHAMSHRYGAMVDALLAQGNRPGCQAHIEHGERGYQLELLMPGAGEALPFVPPQTRHVAPVPTRVVPLPVVEPLPAKAKSSRKGWIWTGVAAAVGLFIIIGATNQPDDKPSQGRQAAGLQVTTTTTQATVAAAPETTATTSTTTSKTTTKAKPKPHTTTKKRTTTHTTTKRKPASNCNPNYTPCIPNGGDLDCGDIDGPVTVVGVDVYHLDRDNDGIGCEG
jgi:hypothetical protein